MPTIESTIIPQWRSYSYTYADFVSATGSVTTATLFGLPRNQLIGYCYVKCTQVFAGSGFTSFGGGLGTVATPFRYITGGLNYTEPTAADHDVFDHGNFYGAPENTEISTDVLMTIGGDGSLSALSAGAFTVFVQVVEMPLG